MIRTTDQLEKIARENPFPDQENKFVGVLMFNDSVADDFLENIKNQVNEEVEPRRKDVYINYTSGMGKSKLKLPNEREGTMRNMNTIHKLIELSEVK